MVQRAPTVIGIDTGGTFTDFVLWRAGSVTVHKVLSTPTAPEQAIVQGLHDLGVMQLDDSPLLLIHGSTVATNAVLEGKGVRTAYITNRGLADVLTIGRQTRRELYNLQPSLIKPPVPKEYCLETGGRISAHGEVLDPLTASDLTQLQQQLNALAPQAVAINLLFSFIDDRFEREIEAALPTEVFITRSSTILPEYKEYERGMTTWLNAYVGPLMQKYLARLCVAVPHAQVTVMQSSGGTIAAEHAGARAVHLLLSGPAGGMAAARFIGACVQQSQLLTFDMGGTSTDVGLIEGDLQLTTEGKIGDYPVAVPMIDLHTIGAGGGSIAYVDAGGVLQVGPQSAGADPGPACYGRGGKAATVTDANLILGRLRVDAFLGGRMILDVDAARNAMQSLAAQLGLSIEATASGIIQLVNEHMAQALRVMSVQRGIDPRQLTLVSFGGAGGLHVCALAEALDMQTALVPVHAGVLSALGMLVAPRSRQLSQTITGLYQDYTAAQLHERFAPLITQGRLELSREGVEQHAIEMQLSVDLRYRGQAYTLNVPWTMQGDSERDFAQLHRRRYGHDLNLPIEIVNLRVALHAAAQHITGIESTFKPMTTNRGSTPQSVGGLPVYRRDELGQEQIISGPALITEAVATTYLADRWQATVDRVGNLRLQRLQN